MYESRTQKSSIDSNIALRVLRDTAGRQRSLFEALAKSASGDPLFSVTYGTAVSTVRGDGSLWVQPKAAKKTAASTTDPADDSAIIPPFPGLSAALRGIITPGAAPLNKKVGAIHIPCGVCAIVAGGGVGKTPLAHTLAASGVDSYGIVRVGEPLAGYAMKHSEVADDLVQAMYHESDIVLDSIKDLLASGSALMKGGISRTALVSLSEWGSLAAALGCTLYVPVNPSGDSALISVMVEQAKSNATMTVWDADAKWYWSARGGEALHRLEGEFPRSITKFDVSSDNGDRKIDEMEVKIRLGSSDPTLTRAMVSRATSVR